MKDWLCHTTLEILGGFLVLIGNYRNFNENYGKIVAPFTALVKKNSFNWNGAMDQAFQESKYFMCTTLVLYLHEFTNTFILESDA
jgi:hypothetical protein